MYEIISIDLTLLIETQDKTTSALKSITPQKLTTIKTAITISRSNRDNKVQPALKNLQNQSIYIFETTQHYKPNKVSEDHKMLTKWGVKVTCENTSISTPILFTR